MQKTQTIQMSIQELLVPATFILMTSAPCRFPFLQKTQLLNNHFQKISTLKTSIQELQVPTTFFLMTYALKITIQKLQVPATIILRISSP